MDKGLCSFICSCGSLVAIVTVYIGLIKDSKIITMTGQILGALDVLFCLLFWLLYF